MGAPDPPDGPRSPVRGPTGAPGGPLAPGPALVPMASLPGPFVVITEELPGGALRVWVAAEAAEALTAERNRALWERSRPPGVGPRGYPLVASGGVARRIPDGSIVWVDPDAE